jgi:N-acetylglucosaminyl-diphospho-decaprenol L-rhamnosyltransferase
VSSVVPVGRSTGGRSVELIVVAYRSRAEVEEMLAGLPADLPLILVDNFDNGDGLRSVILDRPNGRYLAGGGVGFSRAANLGARASQADILVFVNPDARPTLSDIEAIVEDVATDERCSASATVVVGPDGRAQMGVGGWEPTMFRAFVHAVGLHKVFPRSGIYCRPAIGEQVDVDWVAGSCVAIRRETFLALGCFDEDFYVYNEDLSFGRRSRQHRMRPVLRTDVAVPGSTGGSGAPSLEMMRLRGASMSRYLRKPQSRLAAEVTAALLSAGFAARAAVHLLQGETGPAREDWAHAVGLITGRATVAGRLVVDRNGRPRSAL